MFETETDTEVIPKLMLHFYQLKNGNSNLTFEQIVELTVRELVSFCLVKLLTRFI